MRLFHFSRRCFKEILRDPVNLFFGLGFPIVLILLLNSIQSRVPVDIFTIERLTPGISVFGLSFVTMFSATLIARDRETTFLRRLYTTPMKPHDYILGYMIPTIPISLAQCFLCYLVAIALGLNISWRIALAILMIIPISVFYIGLGLLCGSLFNVKQASGLCGGLFTNLSAWLSGAWFDIELVGEVFSKIAKCLPFYHAVELEKAILCGHFDNVVPHLSVVLAYGIGVMLCAIIAFLSQMKKN